MSSLHAVNGSTAKCDTHSCGRLWHMVTLTAGKWHRLLFTGDYDEVFMTKSLNVIRRQQSLTSNKREAQVSSNQRQSSRYYVTDEANY